MPSTSVTPSRLRWFYAAGIFAGLVAFSFLFLLIDQAIYTFANRRFPAVGESAGLATLWGLVSRLHVLIPAVIIALLKPHFVGILGGHIRPHWKMLTGMLFANCGIVAAFIVFTGATPFSGNQWLLTEVISVPIIEELMWRGVILSTILFLLGKAGMGAMSQHIAVLSTGLAFGILHLGNGLTGVPLSFVILQAASAVLWGILYGYAKTTTDSIFPAILLHSAMNLVVVVLG